MTPDPHITVKELIAKLSILPQDFLVYVDQVKVEGEKEQLTGFLHVTSAGVVGPNMVSIGL